MVFFTQTLERTITVHPMHLGPLLRNKIKDQLIAEVEGMPVDSAGFIITVLSIDEGGLSKGLVDALTGFARYRLSFRALMFRPFKNEVLDCEVKSVSEVGFFAEAGPLNLLISSAHIPEEFEFTPEDSSYSSRLSSSASSSSSLSGGGAAGGPVGGAVKIQAGSSVRVRVIGATVLQSSLCAIGSIKEPFLGLLPE